MSAAPLRFERARFLCYRIFDIADEIHLERARMKLSADTRRMRLRRAGSEYLQLPDPPITAELGRRELELPGGRVAVELTARVFSHGAASIILRVPVADGAPFEDVLRFADELFDSRAVDALALEAIQALRNDLGDALESDHLWEQSESYTILFAEQIHGATAEELLDRPELAQLLLGERGKTPLSAQERAEVLQTSFSYTRDDLAVIDWNGAFVYEPSGSMDIPDVLEIVNAQLLELRYYDDLLDRSIRGVYEGGLVSAPPRILPALFRSPYRHAARRALRTLLEMSEFIERVENSLKIIGDFYLARVYEGGVKRLRIRQWQAAVTRKQQILTQVYGLLRGEVDTDRALTLEAAIVLLIVFEIVWAMLEIGG